MTTVYEKEISVVPRICLARECGLKTLYFREVVHAEELLKQLERVTKKNQIYREAIASLLSSVKELLKPDHAALNLLKERLSSVAEVLGVYYFVKNEVITLWVLIKEENFEAEMEIADSLAELFSVFRNLRFDFMVVPVYDMEIKKILPHEAEMVFSKLLK